MGFAVFVQVGFLILLCLSFSSANSLIHDQNKAEQPHGVAYTGGAGGPRITGGGSGNGGWAWRPPVGGSYPVPKPRYGHPHPMYPPRSGGGGGGGGSHCPYHNFPTPMPGMSCPVGCMPAPYGYGELHHWAQMSQVHQNLGMKNLKWAHLTPNGPLYGSPDVTHGYEAQINVGKIDQPTPQVTSQKINEPDPDSNSNQQPLNYRVPEPISGPDFEFGTNSEDKTNPGIGPNAKPKKDGEPIKPTISESVQEDNLGSDEQIQEGNGFNFQELNS